MLGWTILFSLITALATMFAAVDATSANWAARSVGLVFGSLLVLCLFCEIAGSSLRDRLQ